jgi:DNA-binding transcriptional LysR family regulator
VIDDTALALDQVARDRLVVVVGLDHRWSEIGRVEPRMLTETEWVLREPGSGTRSVFEAALRDLGLSPAALPIALELPSNEAVRAAVEAGMGATAISASVAAPSLEAGLLRKVEFDLPDRAYSVVRHVERHRSKAAEALLAMVCDRPVRRQLSG